jgi:hypothetical protein
VEFFSFTAATFDRAIDRSLTFLPIAFGKALIATHGDITLLTNLELCSLCVLRSLINYLWPKNLKRSQSIGAEESKIGFSHRYKQTVSKPVGNFVPTWHEILYLGLKYSI